MGKIIITRAANKDLRAIAEIERSCFSSPWDELAIVMTLDDPRGYNMVAFDEGSLIGYCFAHELKEIMHLINLAVRPEHRGRGLGKMLVQDLLSHARSLGKQSVFLEVRPSNHSAKALYKSLGFTLTGTWKRYYRDSGEDAEVLIKRFS